LGWREERFLDLSDLGVQVVREPAIPFDYDPQSAACTKELKRRYGSGASDWEIETGSVLNK